MAVTLYNKTQVDDDLILGFVERADQLLGLTSDVEVKVTQVRTALTPSMYMRDHTKNSHDCLVHLRIPPFVSDWRNMPEDQIEKWCTEAADWFERVVRHEFTHVWQMENLPEWGTPRFDGRRYTYGRRVRWADRPVEIDCEARQDDIKAEEGTEDAEYVEFLKQYYAHEIRTR